MSKMDALRAMREQRYAATAARGQAGEAGQPAATARRARSAAPVPVAPPADAPVDTAGPSSAGTLCGHRAISGRTCTREQGHAEKSHRYS